MQDFEWSPYQLSIFQEVAVGSGHLLVSARAGSSKTTTAVELVNHVPRGKTILFTAFNKGVADLLKSRISNPGCEVMTSHSLGFRAVRKAWGHVEVDTDRNATLCDEVLDEFATSQLNKKTLPDRLVERLKWADIAWEDRIALRDLVSLSKAMLCSTPEESMTVAANYGIESITLGDQLGLYAQKVMDKAAERGPSIDFDDMIWLPAALELTTPKWDFVVIDEAQDWAPAQLWVVQRALKPGGRFVFLLDPRQALYGWRAASPAVIAKIIEDTKAKTLPLPICYRCPKRVVALAQEIVPDIQAWSEAKEGVVEWRTDRDVVELAAPGDAIISRTSAPLMGLCLRLLRSGKPAVILGRDVGKSLAALIIKSRAAEVTELASWLSEYKTKEVAKLIAGDKQEAALKVNDRVNAIFALLDGCDSIPELKRRIDQLFVDDPKGRITLGTVHAMKGQEYPRVWMILGTFARYSSDIESMNIAYVAVTRAMESLFLVTGQEDVHRCDYKVEDENDRWGAIGSEMNSEWSKTAALLCGCRGVVFRADAKKTNGGKKR